MAMENGEGSALIDLVRRARSGDMAAFTDLVRQHHGRCIRYAERALGSRADAEDAVQRAFVRMHRALGRYREEERFSSWLVAIVANECRAMRRQAGRRLRHEFNDDDAVQRAVADPPVSDETVRIERAISRLDPLLREAFLLRHVEGLSYREMERVAGARESALKMRVMRACEALRAFLEER